LIGKHRKDQLARFWTDTIRTARLYHNIRKKNLLSTYVIG